MSLNKEIWIRDIQEQLYLNNTFMERATDHSMYIIPGNRKVHIPNAGSKPTVVINRSSLPASASQRTDVDLTYDVNDFTIDPQVLNKFEELEINYDKRKSLLFNQYKELGQTIANNTLYSWAPSGVTASIIRTSGASQTAALAPSATGARLSLTLKDVATARAVLDKQNVPQDGRVMIIPSDIFNFDLLAIANINQYLQFGTAVTPNGQIKQVYGFDIYSRPSVCVYGTGSGSGCTPKAINDAGDPSSPTTTDNMAILCYHPDFVSKAQSEPYVFLQLQNPLFYGDVYSAGVLQGSSPLRSDGAGIVAIVQI
jgi:hypothetical protein